MTELAVRINATSSEDPVKEQVTVKKKLRVLYVTMHVLSLAQLGLLIYLFYQTYQVFDSPDFNIPLFVHYARIYGTVTAIQFVVLTLCLLIAYIYLIIAMRTMRSDEVSGVRKNMKCLFFLFFLSYVLRVVFSIFDGKFREVFGSQYTRTMLQLFLIPLFDIPSIGAILFMHHRNYRDQE